MDSKKLLPIEILSLTSELAMTRHARPSHKIYLITLLSIVSGALSLPFLFVDVSVNCPGILRATTELTSLKSTSAGVLKYVLVTENKAVAEGDLLFEIESALLEEKINFLKSKAYEVNLLRSDLHKLIDSERVDSAAAPDHSYRTPVTAFYQQSLTDYRRRLADRKTRLRKVSVDFDRNKKLFDVQVIAAAELENFAYELDKARADMELLKESQLTAWQQDLKTYEKEVADYETQLNQAFGEKETLRIKAPVKGTIQNLAGVYPGSSVFANQELAQISPDTTMLAEVLVTPGDVGLLHEGMDVRMQISSFNYNQWGLLTGKIKEISSDIQVVQNQPVFEVKCLLDQNFLQLKNGTIGKFKKGMTLQARFLIAKRSLWQLLYDKVDNWVNPQANHKG